MFVLVVSLRVKPGKDQQFLAAIEANATASRRDEPGCRRFDVLRDNADPHHYLLYEMYDNEATFQAHRNMPHFPVWGRAAAECLDEHATSPPARPKMTFSDALYGVAIIRDSVAGGCPGWAAGPDVSGERHWR